MTTQCLDSCTVDGRRWEIEHWDGTRTSIPTNEQLGFRTVSPSTANWSGRIDHFLVHHQRLYLFKIEVTFDREDKTPPPSRLRRELLIRYEPVQVYDAKGMHFSVREHRFEYLVFDDLIIPFSGELHLIYPYVDPWELPLPIDEKDEETTERRVLYFDAGILQ